MLSGAAFNALLKILEEPPEHLMFILATTELHKVLPTILSRCQRFAFRRISPRDIESQLDYVAKQEGIELRPDGAELLSRLSDGALRDALSLLDQCAATGGVIDAQAVLDTLGLAGNVQTAQLMALILQRDAKAALLLLHKLYPGGKDVDAVLGELATLARDLLISSTAPEGGAALLSGGYDAGTLGALQKAATNARLIQICTVLQETTAALQNSVNRRTDAELCLLRLCDESLSGDLTAINARMTRIEERLAAGVAYAAAAAPVIDIPAPVPAPAPESPAPAEEPTIEDAPLEDDGPPPYGEPIAESAPVVSEPSPRSEPAPDPEPAPQQAAGSTEPYASLMDNFKNRLAPNQRSFIGKTQGVLNGSVLTVYCPSEIHKARLDDPAVVAVINELMAPIVGQALTVRFVVGAAPDDHHDKMNDLVRMGSKFGGFTMK